MSKIKILVMFVFCFTVLSAQEKEKKNDLEKEDLKSKVKSFISKEYKVSSGKKGGCTVETIMEFNEDGMCTFKKKKSTAGVLVTKKQYKNGNLIKHEYTAFGKNRINESYVYDSNNNLIEINNHIRKSKNKRKYLRGKNKLKSEKIYMNGEQEYTFHNRYKYGHRGLLAKIERYKGFEVTPYKKTEFKYDYRFDKKSVEIKYSWYANLNKLAVISSHKWHYDKKGRVVKEEDYTAGSLRRVIKNSYDADGYLLEVIHEKYINGEPKKELHIKKNKGKVIYYYSGLFGVEKTKKYNSKGYVKEESIVNGGIKYTYEYDFDSRGNITKANLFKSGKLISIIERKLTYY